MQSDTEERRMKQLVVFTCLLCVAFTQDTVIDPRGARPVEHGTRDEKCATQKEWPFCLDDDWGHKCPSGCRIQGLMDKYDHDLLKRIEYIRDQLNQHKGKYRSADQVSKQTHDYLREKLTVDAGHDNKYFELAQSLRQRITEIKIRIDRQMKVMAALKGRIRDQVTEMQRLEVDIDMKLRSCKGSCATYLEYQVDQQSYVTLEKQVAQLDSQTPQNIEAAGTLYVMKSRPLKDLQVDSIYKSKAVQGQQKQDLFSDIKTLKLVLEEEGSSSSPATVSKEPGTPFPSTSSSSSSSSPSSSGSSNPSKSITELGGRGDTDFFGGGLGGFDGFSQTSTGSVTTKRVSCTTHMKKVVVQTKSGPVERYETVTEGGPECQGGADLTKGGLTSLFPSLSHTSSSMSTKSGFSSGAKGGLLGNPFEGDLGSDLGAFMTDNAEDDLPDFHARSLGSTVVNRQADYVGKDCVEANQKHLKGETNGLFKIKPGGADSTQVVEVYCQQEGVMGGWLLVQQRESGALSFNRTWAEYRGGFGSVDAQGKGEFWLGNENLHLLTSQGETILKVELEDWEGGKASAEYTMRVGSEQEGFPLHVSGYTGDAGDSLAAPTSEKASEVTHNGMKFSAFDKDNDNWGENCAEAYGGGWWYNSCQAANLNGVYYKGEYDPATNMPYKTENGVVWSSFKPVNYSLKTVRMLIRSAAF
uniref:Fibrinogen alpha chain n=1 Tax=Oryzias latipes TaxID=8090 RepID=A0A3P9LK56_ORYLA